VNLAILDSPVIVLHLKTRIQVDPGLCPSGRPPARSCRPKRSP